MSNQCYHYVAAASTNATAAIKNAATLLSIQTGNNSSSVAYLKFYDSVGPPTPGVGTPKKVIIIPGNSAGAGNNPHLPPDGIFFDHGISFTITAGVADTDTVAVSGSAINVEFDYR